MKTMNLLIIKVCLLFTASHLGQCRIIDDVVKQGNAFYLPYLSNIHPNSVKHVQESCEEATLDHCTEDLAKNLNFTQIPDWKTLQRFLIKTVLSNIQGFEEVCKATNDYVACIGPDEFDSCLSVPNLISEGVSQVAAVNYVIMAQQMKYQCGPAFDVFYSNYDCMRTDSMVQSEQIMYCNKNLIDSISSDPSNLCQAIQQFISCDVKVFENCGADFEMALCESFQQGNAAGLPQCSITCRK